MLLKGKNAVVYGGGGAVGGAVGRAFAREGARVFLAGRTLGRVEAVAAEIDAAGGVAHTAVVDARDQQSLAAHAGAVVAQAGTLDIAFNAVLTEDVFGTCLVDMVPADFVPPLTAALTTQFLVAKAVAPHMMRQSSGVIMAMTAPVGRVGDASLVGSFGTVCAATEGFVRQLAAELGPYGIRVVCLRSAGSPDSPGVDWVLRDQAAAAGTTREEVEASWTSGIPLRRLPRLAEVGNVAAMLAADHASPLTGTVANVTCGGYVD